MVNFNQILRKIKNNWKNYLLILLVILLVGNIISYNNYDYLNQYSNGILRSGLGLESEYSNIVLENSVPIKKSLVYNGANEDESRIIKNANMDLEVENFQNSINNINEIFKNNNVIILRESFSKNYNDLDQVNYNLKVNSKNLEQIINKLKLMGEVKYLTINSNDVQKSFEDYSDRKQRYLTQIEKYKKMLNSSKLTIEDEIKIQQRIDSLEDSLFYIEKRINNIDEDVKYSNIYLTIQEKPTLIEKSNFLNFEELVNLFLNSIANGFNFIIKLLGYTLPYIIIFGLYLLFRKVLIRIK